MSERILVVEDEIGLQEALTYNLKKEGFQVDCVGDGLAAIRLARQNRPNLILLDIMLPGIDGFEVCQIIRQDLNSPIIFLTARDDEVDRVIGLEIGADDYISKPFSMRELIARVKARLRMTRSLLQQAGLSEDVEVVDHSKKVHGNLSIDTKRREICVNGKQIRYKPKEFELMQFFSDHLGRVITREYILKHVWGYDYAGDSRTIDVHVRWLREKIENEPSNPTRIVTVRGGGYRFEG